MPEKVIALHFFQLQPIDEDESQEARINNIKSIQNVFEGTPEKWKPIVLSDGKVTMFGPVEKRKDLYLGTLIKNQLTSIPPSFDESDSKLEKLPLNANQGLAYQTCFLYYPELRIVMIQSVKNGVGIGTFCSLLNSNYEIPAVEPGIVIHPAKMKDFLAMGIITKFRVKIAKVQSGTIFKADRRTSLGQIISSSDHTNTDILEYSLSTRKRNESLAVKKIRSIVDSALKYDNLEVKQLSVKGKEDEESDSDTINFIEQKLQDHMSIEKERLISSFQIAENYQKMVDVFEMHKKDLRDVYKIKAKL
jgi:hypothetical protein